MLIPLIAATSEAVFNLKLMYRYYVVPINILKTLSI